MIAGRGFSGGVELGASRDYLRSMLGSGVSAAPDFGGEAQDYFMQAGMVILYDGAGVAVQMVAVAPARPSFEGIALIGRSLDEVGQEALNRGISVSAEEAELQFLEAGFRIWPARVGPGESLPVVGVSIP